MKQKKKTAKATIQHRRITQLIAILTNARGSRRFKRATAQEWKHLAQYFFDAAYRDACKINEYRSMLFDVVQAEDAVASAEAVRRGAITAIKVEAERLRR